MAKTWPSVSAEGCLAGFGAEQFPSEFSAREVTLATHAEALRNILQGLLVAL